MKGMLKPVTIFMAIALLAAAYAAASPSADEVTQSVREFYENLNKENLVLTKLKYYIHAVFAAGPEQTVFQVASCDISRSSASNFGGILVIDNKLTVSPDPDSQYVGQYQGMNAYSDFQVQALNMNMNIVFHGGEYDGSTISIMGRQPVPEKVRVLSVIGGTGVFRLARGSVLASTYSVDPVAKTGVYLYEIFVVTPAVGKSSTAA